jgi:hypothetical protein
MLEVLDELQELDGKEGIVLAWEDGLVASKRALRRVCVERDTEHARLRLFNRITWPGRAPLHLAPSILHSLQETDLEVREAKLVEEQAHSLHPFDGWDLPTELEKLHARMAGVDDEHAIEARELLRLVVKISNALVNLGMLLIQDIPNS